MLNYLINSKFSSDDDDDNDDRPKPAGYYAEQEEARRRYIAAYIVYFNLLVFDQTFYDKAVKPFVIAIKPFS